LKSVATFKQAPRLATGFGVRICGFVVNDLVPRKTALIGTRHLTIGIRATRWGEFFTDRVEARVWIEHQKCPTNDVACHDVIALALVTFCKNVAMSNLWRPHVRPVRRRLDPFPTFAISCVKKWQF
jgi:hypothetical protein